EYYTDGSAINNRTGYAIVSDSTTLVAQRTHDHNSVFTCEARAILHALELIINRQDTTNSTIYSDSMSCLKAIENLATANPVIQTIHKTLDQLKTLNKSVTFVWIPAHIGIQGNELADQAAKAATNAEY
ncbi:GSCOCG00011688001-RA-CDS, partial [Cotesia congregata]